MEKYFQIAIQKDNSDAMYNLARFYENRTFEIAVQYYQMAVLKGNENAIKRLAELNIV